MVTGTNDFLRLLVPPPGSAYLCPDGNSLYAAKRGWVQSAEIARAVLVAKNGSSLSLVPAILLHG